jgi:hypothetical protein
MKQLPSLPKKTQMGIGQDTWSPLNGKGLKQIAVG